MTRRTFALAALALMGVSNAQVPDAVLKAEADRVAVIARIRPSVVAIFAAGGQGGGSGVLIDADGYALTNFHVVQGNGPTMQCGLPDGVLYDAVLVGLDKVGDVALIKLLPKEKGKPFPFAVLGDSETVRPGDWSMALGNPFLLATDFTPTVTFGLVSGVHRYQYPSGSILEYTDCIQIDTSINPGNSGGPLFNAAGELIGINGRGSFEKRGRVNSGVGYAISINQIKNFLDQLRAGIDTDHATLGATVRTAEDGDIARMTFASVLDEADAARRDIRPDDELVEFAGRPMATVNQYKNVLGIYPRGWRLPITTRRNNVKKESLVRLMGLLPKDMQEKEEKKSRRPNLPIPGIKPKAEGSAEALKLFKAKSGFANYYFNEKAQERVLARLKDHGDMAGLTGPWTFAGELERNGQRSSATFTASEQADAKGTQPLVKVSLGGVDYGLNPLKAGADSRDLRDPPASGGLLMALYHYRRLLALGPKGFEGGFTHGGGEPCYPPQPGKPPRELRVDCEVLLTEHAAVTSKWFFRKGDGVLIGCEIALAKDEDPCELYFGDYKPVDGRSLPHRIDVVFGDASFGTLHVREHKVK